MNELPGRFALVASTSHFRVPDPLALDREDFFGFLELDAHPSCDNQRRMAHYADHRLHAAQVRRQKEFLRSIGVPDLSPEEVSERARRRPSASQRTRPEPTVIPYDPGLSS